MQKDIEKLFGSAARVRILRYLLAHREESIAIDTLTSLLKVSKTEMAKELLLLRKIKAVEDMVVEEFYDNGKSKKLKGIRLSPEFPYTEGLAQFLLDFRFIDKKELAEGFKKFGKIKLLCLSGIFVTNGDPKMDLLVAGDAIDKPGMEKFIKTLEAELGRELNFAIFESEEFTYRVSMYDRFIRDFFKFQHELLIEKISIKP